MTSPEIRILTLDDVAAYRAIRLEMLESEPEAFGSSPEDHNKLSEEEIRRRLTADLAERFIFGAFVDGQLVGVAGFVREPQVKARHKGRIWGVYLKAELRGQGIGRRMLQSILDRVHAIDGLEQILISVTTAQSAAQSLYRSLGFVSFGVEPRALKIANRYVDEQYMVLEIARRP